MDRNLTFNLLVAEHLAIESEAIAMCDSLEGKEALSVTLFTGLDNLSNLVKAHLHNEEVLLAGLSQAQIDDSRLQLWIAAANDFDRLRSDWLSFLAEWDLDTIERRRAEFAVSARSILARLTERVRFESETFYVVAVQSGALRQQ